MGSETDIRHAISLRPSPFQRPSSDHTGSPHRSEIRRSDTAPASHHPQAHPPNSPDSTITAVGRNSSLDRHRQGSLGREGRQGSICHASVQAASDAPPTTSLGHSTAWEALTPPAEGVSDPIARHVAGGGLLLASAQTDRADGAIAADLEDRGEGRRWDGRNDPFNLSEKIKSPQEISQIRANTSRKRRLLVPSNGKPMASGRKLQHFYEEQNENIERLLKPVDDHRQEAKDTYGENELRFKIAVNGSLVANLLLAALQLYAAVSSKSLSLFTTMADALFDPLSNLTLIISHRAINQVDGRRFPSGKARIETAANIAFCFIMTAVSLIIIVQSIRDLAAGSLTRTNPFHLPSAIAVGVAFTVKLCLFLYCFALRNMYSQIRILWEDHRNDLIINGTGLLFSLLGSHVLWWIDPAGAIVISCLIIFLWMRTAHSEFLLLIGVTAETNILQLITYICKSFVQYLIICVCSYIPAMTHSDDIAAIDTVRAYYSGPRLIVEVDIVMKAEDSLKFTHDTAEDLQTKLESLPNVERAYVHVDYETSHAPEHFLKKEL
jgi:divalent metal cation (Fe/Co/Zn/Cd) transporter